MENEYIEVKNAIDYLMEALGENKNRVGYFLDNYGFFSLTLYLSNDDGITLETADDLTIELFQDYFKRKYPYNGDFILALNHTINPLANLMQDISFYNGKKYYWKAKDFYNNKIFKKIQIPKDKVIGYCFTLNIDETTQKLLNQKQEQIDRLTAKNQQQADTIKQLNERLEAGEAIPKTEKQGDSLLI